MSAPTPPTPNELASKAANDLAMHSASVEALSKLFIGNAECPELAAMIFEICKRTGECRAWGPVEELLARHRLTRDDLAKLNDSQWARLGIPLHLELQLQEALVDLGLKARPADCDCCCKRRRLQ